MSQARERLGQYCHLHDMVLITEEQYVEMPADCFKHQTQIMPYEHRRGDEDEMLLIFIDNLLQTLDAVRRHSRPLIGRRICVSVHKMFGGCSAECNLYYEQARDSV